MTFQEILEQYNIPFRSEGHHHCRNGWLQLDCCYCGSGTEGYHLGYNLSGKYLNCWRCGYHNVIKAVMELTHTEYKQAKDIYTADALMLLWNGADENMRREKESAIKARKPIYEVLHNGYNQHEDPTFRYIPYIRYIRRLPTLK